MSKRGEKGITLVALAITVVVLVILAGVAIRSIVGEDGLIEMAEGVASNLEKTEGQQQTIMDNVYNDMIQVANPTNPYVSKYVGRVPIPKGFYYVGGSEETGLVISDHDNDLNQGDSHDIIQNLQGNQFVWIPVSEQDYAEMIDETTKRGKLYSFDSNGVGTLIEDCLTTTTGYREPAYLEDSSIADASANNTVGITPESLQKQFDDMAASVKYYKGFYVARFEASSSSDGTKSQSKYATSIQYSTWYQAYDKLRNLNTSSTSVTANLIWDCQWDRMLKYVNGSLDGGGGVYNVGATQSSRHNASGRMNTGSNINDRVKNIYDISGNIDEWTMGSNSNNAHIKRAGGYWPPSKASNRGSATVDKQYYTGRQTLSIKVP